MFEEHLAVPFKTTVLGVEVYEFQVIDRPLTKRELATLRGY